MNDGRSNPTEPWTAFWQSRAHPEEYYRASETVCEQLLPYVSTGTRVLEIGPGTGRDAVALERHGARIVLLDFSAAALELAAVGTPSVRSRCLVQGDGLRAPFPDGAFDVVFHQGLLEHFRDPVPLLTECHRLLHSGGVLLVDVPQTFHAWTVIKKTLIAMDRWFAGWETQYTAAQLERRVAAAGFEIVSTYGDWMRPSLAYRLTRAGLAKLKVPLPQYPPTIPVLHRVRSAIRRQALRQRLALYLTLSVGVLARKSGSGTARHRSTA